MIIKTNTSHYLKRLAIVANVNNFGAIGKYSEKGKMYWVLSLSFAPVSCYGQKLNGKVSYVPETVITQ